MNLATIIAICGVAIALGGFLATYFGFITKIYEVIGDLKKELGKVAGINFEGIFYRLSGIETRLGTINIGKMNESLIALETKIGNVNLTEIATKMNIFWDSMEGILKEMLHHPDPAHQRKDMLLERFPDLTVEEMCELRDLIKAEKTDLLTNTPKGSRDWGYVLGLGLMQARVETALVDKKGNC